MNKTTRLIILLLLFCLILLPATVHASSFEDDKVIFGSNYALQEGETLNGDLIVFGGNVTLADSSTINGDTVIFGGNLTSNGTINGNLVGLGGFVTLGENAQVQGDLTVLGSSYQSSATAVITGNIITEESIPFDFNLPETGIFEGDFPVPRLRQLPVFSTSWFFFQVLIWTGLAILIGLFITDQAVVINRTAFNYPVQSFIVGLGIVFVGPLILLALFITVLLIPVSLVGIFALIAAWVVGLVSLSIEIGRKLVHALGKTLPVPLLAGVGMFILSIFLTGFSQLIWCVGWLPRFILGTWVFGAVFLTRFGTHAYPEKKDQVGYEAIPEDFPDSNITANDTSRQEINATKAALEMAETEGVDLTTITGSGAEGRIILNDVRKAIKDQE